MKKINLILQNKSYYHIYQSSFICHIAQEIIEKNINKKIGSISYKNRKIKLTVNNSFLAKEINLNNNLLLDLINKKLGKNLVLRLQVLTNF